MSSISYVVFALDKEEYGIEISYAQEILRIPGQITKIPNMPSYIEGVIDLRGKVIPIIDLKKRFGLLHTDRGSDSRLLILDYNNNTIAFIVDDVSEIITMDEDTVDSISSVISGLGMNTIRGIGRIENRLIQLIDVVKLNIEVFQSKLSMEEQL